MNVDDEIYLDNAATTALDPEVLEAMLPFLADPRLRGNASSVHRFGRDARTAIDSARDAVAALICCDYSEIYFTSGGTEADNLALIGAATAANGRDHVVTTAIEHHAVLHAVRALEDRGFRSTVVSVEANGIVDPGRVRTAVNERTAIVSVMTANNEIGTIQPVEEIARIARSVGALFHTDAVQAAGQLPVNVHEIGCDLLSISAHKIYGPKGVGALYVRSGTKVHPLIVGGAQEREKRAGTENVAAIVGFGRAAELAASRLNVDPPRIAALRDRLLHRLNERVEFLSVNGAMFPRLPNNLNVSVPDCEGPTLLMNLDRRGVAVSSGSACSSGSIEPSHVLKAIGLTDGFASSGIRFSLGRTSTEQEIDRAAEILGEVVERLAGDGTIERPVNPNR